MGLLLLSIAALIVMHFNYKPEDYIYWTVKSSIKKVNYRRMSFSHALKVALANVLSEGLILKEHKVFIH